MKKLKENFKWYFDNWQMVVGFTIILLTLIGMLASLEYLINKI